MGRPWEDGELTNSGDDEKREPLAGSADDRAVTLPAASADETTLTAQGRGGEEVVGVGCSVFGVREAWQAGGRGSAGSGSGLGRAEYGEEPNADAALLEDDHGSLAEWISDAGQVGEEERDLGLGPPLRGASEEDDRRLSLLPQGEQCAEVGVCGDDDALFGRGPLEDLLVAGLVHAVVAHVGRIVARVAQTVRHQRRERVVNEESHGVAARGSSRSRTASAA